MSFKIPDIMVGEHQDCLVNILKRLPKQDLQNCRLVSRSFKLAADILLVDEDPSFHAQCMSRKKFRELGKSNEAKIQIPVNKTCTAYEERIQKLSNDEKILKSKLRLAETTLKQKTRTPFGRFVTKITFSSKWLKFITKVIERLFSSVKKELESRKELQKIVVASRVKVQHKLMQLQAEKTVIQVVS